MIMPMNTQTLKKIKPFLKWAGGKSQLLPQFQDLYPAELKTGAVVRYIEPFVGGGAVFFDIVSQFDVQSFYLLDANVELILIYRVVQRDPIELVERLQDMATKYLALSNAERKRFYYSVRDKFNATQPYINYQVYSRAWIERAAQLLFMNRTCFNGLFRLNSKGQFNVPHGRYKNPKIVDPDNIYNASLLLQKAEIICGDFTVCEQWVTENTFVYFDPPYRPLNTTSSFTSYSQDKFNDADQIRLSKFFRQLAKRRNVYLMLSNSDPTNENANDDFFKRLYSGFNIHTVSANRMINSNPEKRGKIRELVITNY